MQKISQRTVITYFILVALLAGCGSSNTKVTRPMLSEIPPIPVYPDISEEWNTQAVCWVGGSENANWKWDLPSSSTESILWVKDNTSVVIQKLLKEGLKKAGYTVREFDNEYLTRQKRLSLNKRVLFQEFDINEIMVSEGTCYDMKLTVEVIDSQKSDQSDICEIWGRSVLMNDETREWTDVYRDCITNIKNAPEFRNVLEM